MALFRRVLAEATILVAFVVLAIFLSATTPGFASTTNGLSILLATSLIAVVAVGETFVVVTGGIDLSIGSIVALTGIITGLALHAGLPVPLAVLLAMVFGGVIGLFNGVAVAYFGMNSFIVTLAMLAMARGLAFIVASGNTVFGFPQPFDDLGGSNFGPVPIAAIISLGIVALGAFALSRTVFGSNVYAVGGNREAARLAGIPVRQTLLAAYIVSGVLAGVGGVILTGRLDSAQPIAATGLELNAIAAVVIGGASLFGGKGNIGGTLLGVLIIGLINNGLTLNNVQPFWVQFIQGAVIFVAALADSIGARRRGAVA
jgi:ribose/xylose/arabinose/galactoside ABC-type transport system permease subunit